MPIHRLDDIPSNVVHSGRAPTGRGMVFFTVKHAFHSLHGSKVPV